jgi:hypothetical protein
MCKGTQESKQFNIIIITIFNFYLKKVRKNLRVKPMFSQVLLQKKMQNYNYNNFKFYLKF